jgi:hypothetical protein
MLILIHDYYLIRYFFSDVQFLEEKVKYMSLVDIIEYLNIRDEDEKLLLIIFVSDLSNDQLERMRKIPYKNVKIVFIGTEEQINMVFVDNFRIKNAKISKIFSPIKLEYLKKLIETEIYKCLVD